MKIGILTFHKAYNYGAYMQAYSLQIALKKRFQEHQIDIIDFVPAHEIYRYWIKVPAWILLHQGVNATIDQFKKYFAFSRGWKSFQLSDPAGISSRMLNKRVREYDYIIVGSDAVFNDTNLTGISGISPFFLEGVSVPKASYAASAHGVDFMKFDNMKKERIKKALNGFQILSVRDTHTEHFIENMCGIDRYCRIMHACDPTVFLDGFEESKDVIELINDRRKYSDHIVALMLKTERYSDIIKSCEKENTTFISLANENKNADIQMVNATPFEWATCLKYVDYTVTDYFHGTLVSLRMGRPVISIDISKRKNGNKTKIEDLLFDRLDLPQFYFSYRNFEDAAILDRIKKQCEDNCIEDYSEAISKGLSREASSFNLFCEKLARSIGI